MLYIIIILLLLILYLNNTEGFETKKLYGISGTNMERSKDFEINNLSSNDFTKKNNIEYITETEKKIDKKQEYLDNVSQQYQQILEEENKGITFFYNDTIDQSKITQNAYNIINQVDNIDYSKIMTGIDKCRLKCMNGTCMEGGFSGVASCIPKATSSFDYGTLYKNPEFTYGLQVPYYNTNNKFY